MVNVSVIIPTFNRKDLLVKTLQNVLQQTLRPFEVIVVDDHSSDGTYEFIKSRFGSEIIILQSEGKGPGAARNTGLKRATGTYIKFFDSDDLMSANTLEVQSSILSTSEKGCIYSPYFQASEIQPGKWKLTNDAIIQFFPAPHDRSLQHWMLRGLFITLPGFLFKKTFLDKVGLWRTDIITYEDWDYLWRIANLEPFPLHTNLCAFLYRIHGVQITDSSLNDTLRDKDKVKCFMEIAASIKTNPKFRFLDKAIFASMIAGVLQKHASESWVNEVPFQWRRNEFKLINAYLRVNNKLGRLNTSTDWQPMHGPIKSAGKVDAYLRLIDPDFEISNN